MDLAPDAPFKAHSEMPQPTESRDTLHRQPTPEVPDLESFEEDHSRAPGIAIASVAAVAVIGSAGLIGARGDHHEQDSRSLKEADPAKGVHSVSTTELHSPPQVAEQMPSPEPPRVPDEPVKAIRPGFGIDIIRSGTPAVVLPDLNDNVAQQMSRARSVRKQRRLTIKRAEEDIAAAVVIYATADALSPPSSPPLSSTNVSLDVKHELALSGERVKRGRRTIEEERALRDSVADILLDDKLKQSSSKRDEAKSSSSTRSSHRSSHRSRSAGQHRHHRRRAASETSARSGSDHSTPRTPKRQDSGFSATSGHSSPRKQRTPEEQAAHDRRKAERRAREKEQERSAPPPKDKGKEKELSTPSSDKSKSRDRRSSRRQSMSQSDRRQSMSQSDRRQSMSQSDRRQSMSQSDRRQSLTRSDRRQGGARAGRA